MITGNTIGVEFRGSSTANTVGGGTPNRISGNITTGVLIGSDANVLTGNLIGLDAAGTAAEANPDGVVVDGFFSSVGNTISANTIAGNTQAGIRFRNAGTGATLVSGNVVGLTPAGLALANATGISIDSSVVAGLVIGDATPNTISGNDVGARIEAPGQTLAGNWFGLDLTGTAARPNGRSVELLAADTTIGGTTAATRNIFSGQLTSLGSTAGILVDDAASTGTTIIGNWFGLASDGLATVPNSVGIQVASTAPAGLVIGGAAPNTIGGNTDAGILVQRSGTTVETNLIGFDSAGNLEPNLDGIVISGASGVTIGGTTAGEANTIGGNTNAGVALRGAGTTNSSILGNRIGLGLTGAAAPNAVGVLVEDSAGSGNSIGGTTPNTISGNTTAGVEVRGDLAIIAGNWIGLDLTGTSAIANGVGVLVDGALDVEVGSVGAPVNVISGNTAQGVLVTGASDGTRLANNMIGVNPVQSPVDTTTAIPNAVGVEIDAAATGVVTVGHPTAPNSIAGNTTGQVVVRSSNHVVAGNVVGFARNGTSAPTGAAAGAFGVAVLGQGAAVANAVVVGRTGAGEGNSIGFVNIGVRIEGPGATAASVAANRIGLDLSGTAAAPVGTGVLVAGAGAGVTIGGSTAALRNIISGATGSGVELSGQAGALVAGNWVGLDTTGEAPIANLVGVLVLGTSDANTISGNIVSGNTDAGIELRGAGATRNAIAGNVVGLSATGADLGVGSNDDGVLLSGVALGSAASGNTIGGLTAADGNTISGNRGNGVLLTGGSAFTVIARNRIGLDLTGLAARGNDGDGVRVDQGSDNTIGALGAGNGNTISANAGWGVEILGAGSVRNILFNNAIGLNTAGAGDLPNLLGPINITNGDNTIGTGNTINASGLDGIVFDGPAASNNLVEGVTIVNGLTAVVIRNGATGNTIGSGNDFRNNQLGVRIDNASANTVVGSTIASNALGGIVLENGASDNSIGGGNSISGNAGPGVEVRTGATDNTIGGATPNTISGNTGAGVLLTAGGNLVSGNSISGNTLVGVRVADASANTIGPDNSISDNLGDGVEISGAASTNTRVIGNLISGNLEAGLRISDGASSTNVDGANTITGNFFQGVVIETGATLNTITGNSIASNGGDGVGIDSAPANVVGPDNTISANLGDGVEISGATSTGNRVFTNAISDNSGAGVRIGTTASGNTVDAANTISGNDLEGLVIETGATLNTISANSIAGSTRQGVLIQDAATTGNSISGNTISSNTGDGVAILDAPANIVGPGNTISAGLARGLSIAGLDAIGNSVTGNSISGNSLDGVEILQNASANTISGNTIRSNVEHGVAITGSAFANRVASNSIGLNFGDGVLIDATADNVVASNTVTGNSGNGVRVSGAAAQRNLIQGGEVTVNSFDGVRIENSATANTISGVLVTGNGRAGVSLESSGNLLTGGSIGGNSFEGVAVTGGSNTVTGATITSNTGVGVALVGPTATANLITANSISGGATEGIFLFQAPGNSIGAAGLGNTVSGNVGDGIELVESNGNSLVDNVVFDNDANGIVIRSSASNSLSGNVSVGHDTGDGLLITGDGSNENVVVSFVTGLDTNISPNANRRGIAIFATPGTSVARNTIGGTTSAEAVVVNDNLSTGIDLSGTGVVATLIRTTRVLRNTGPGIMLSGATASTIGGGGVETFNLVSAGAESGIILALGTTGTLVVGNRIGTDLAGLLDSGNAGHGLVIAGATGSTVTGNLISGNGASGIAFLGIGTAANRIVGNTIGLGLTGARLGNDGSGIRSNGGDNNTIGGTATGEPNYISGNVQQGILLSNDSQGNLVEGNRIGIGLDDATAVGNAIGVAIVGTAVAPTRSTSANVVRSNFIAGNADQGIDVVGLHAISNTIASNDIGRTPTGAVIGNGSNLFTGNGVHTGDRASSNRFDSNRVVGSFGNGFLLDTGARANLLTGNISTANGVDGAQIFGNSSANPTQGNTLSGNTFSGNAANGLRLLQADATGNDIRANIIGFAADGTTPLGNAGRGMLVQDAVANTISNNSVGSNGASGIELVGATANAILDNRVGLDAAGTVAPNGGWGVTLLDASSNSVGGNTIAGNRDGGLLILGSAARGNLIGGNSIGLALDGAVLPAGSRGDAILIGSLAAENTVAGNLLSGHQGNGLRITTGATANIASANRIGVDVAATSARPNQGSGVVVDESATANTIGAENTISGNLQHGVFLNSPGNTVRGNRIGLNAAGSAPIPNEQQGVVVQAANSTVGPNNTISGNRINNVFVNGTSASDSLIIGNILGLDAAGNTPIEVAPLGPAIVTDLNLAQNGIRVLDTRGVVIRGNVVSGNGYAGILVQDDGADASTTGTTIVDNLIGLNAGGTAAAARASLAQYNNPEIGGDGILILDSPNNVVRSNTISGNPNVGLWILGGGSSLNGVFSNVVGLDAAGLTPIPNHDGIVVRNAPNNIIGGPSPDPGVVRAPLGNTISGAPSVIRAQLSTAISVLTISNVAGQPGADPTIPGTPGFADGTIIEGNFIGPDALGRVIGSVEAPAGPDVGIYLNSVQFTRVHENLISSNGVLGVQLFNNATVFNLDDPTEIRGTRPTIANVLTANSIGTNFEGTAAVPNGQGVFINDASGNTIGGTSRALGNLISGNLNVGLQIMGNNIGNAPEGSPRGTPRNPINQVANNTVGLTRNRVSPLPNDYGIFVNGANNPIEGNNAIGSNRRAPFVNRPARSGPTVDLVNTVPGAGSLVDDSTPIQFVTVSFGQYIDPASAERIGNYRIQELRRRGAATGRSIAIESVSYDQVTRTATITLATPPPGGEVLTFGDLFRITVVGAPTRGIKGRGRPSYFLDGLSASKPGTNFTTQVQRGVELAAESTTATAGRRRTASIRIIDANPGRVVPKTIDPRAVDRLLADPKLGKPTRRPR
ncbi:MAG: right-handed parallel beta-helix repeat-containing protein [Isosphaeraceae bacterium]|nr:right-handed parallel beta-helix repeat-containing protein [Isosphaeraceae bacterium]